MTAIKTVQALVQLADAMGNESLVRRGKALIEQMQREAVQPVAWYEFNESVGAWFLAYSCNPKAKTIPLYAAPQPAQASDRVEQLQPVHSVAGASSEASTVRYAPWSAKTDAEMLHTLSVEFENSVSYCDCGRAEPLRDFDCASMLRDYMAQRAVEAEHVSHGSNEQGSPSPSLRGEPRMLSDEEIEKLAMEHGDAIYKIGKGLVSVEFTPDQFRAALSAILSRAGIGESRHD